MTSPALPSGVPVFRRARAGRLLGGVCAGLSHHLGIEVIAVRLAFVVLTVVDGFGLFLYAALWIVVRLEPRDEAPEAPGLAAAERAGLRQRRRIRMPAAADIGQLVAFGMVVLGLVLLVQALGLGADPIVFWPAVMVALGVVLIWRQTDEPAESDRDAAVTRTGLQRFAGLRWDRGSWRDLVRLGLGAVLVVGGLGTFLALSGQAGDVGVAVAVALVGVVLIGGPGLLRILRELRDERTEHALAQQQADVAAHLHDSVLQTLALIQRQANDPREVVRLARSQERDLRGWLYGATAPADSSLRAALERVSAEVEDQHGVPVETVVVGDVPMDPSVQALVRAAREAMVNAAIHSGADRVDVYAEAEDRTITAYVRDRGSGFDPDAIPEGRMGIQGSIIERMRRHGGEADVRSGPGQGTEIRLTISLAPAT